MAERKITKADAAEIGDAVARSLEEGDPQARLERKKRELGQNIRNAVAGDKAKRLERLGPSAGRDDKKVRVGDTYTAPDGHEQKVTRIDAFTGTPEAVLEDGSRVLIGDLTRRGG